MLNKIVLFISIFMLLLTMNSHSHTHVEDHHVQSHHDASNLHTSISQSIEHMNLHLSGHVDLQKSFGIMSGIVLLILLMSQSFFFFILRKKKNILLSPKITYYDQIFIDPPTTLLQSILFHAPPR